MQAILILSLGISLVHAVVQLSPIDFNDQDWAAFVACLRSGIDNYDVTVEEGWINVGPVAARDPDFDGLDALLQKCLIDISSRLMISGGYNVKSHQVRSVSSATSEWLRSQGAQSLESIPIDSIASNSTSISARGLDLDYNGAELSRSKSCHQVANTVEAKSMELHKSDNLNK
jgi:hypothetical protein